MKEVWFRVSKPALERLKDDAWKKRTSVRGLAHSELMAAAKKAKGK